ncbi:MAG: 1-(5-phosphoribosyl)-5-[(5-phosphoribosylamino)methylideneamino]imidazole-4-carboxamide isomerase [Actinobacteria bacterium]|nr:MAG: 1-(5-phosphoribosyl)-5-[(5-phosphoribosylamino)methylideneamino]imidazole-4-carboxamide isomerase [Actinomycetota bacterium]
MIIYPAVDINKGRAVRLKKGDFDQVKVYFKDPVDAAKKWIDQGAKVLHVVDLDGAREGKLINTEPIKKIAALGIKVQLGGGLRTIEALETAFSLGVERAVIGTALIKDRTLGKTACQKFGAEKIVAGVDLRKGLVSIEGWQEGVTVGYGTLLKQLENLGIFNLIVTDISRDGMQSGPNFSLIQDIAKFYHFSVIASGGISSLADVKKLAKMDVAGAIVGTALYEGNFSLKDALEVEYAG